MNVLVIAAHPDDEVLGCGGTIRRLSEDGTQVHIAILGEGVTSRYPDRQDAPQSEIDQLRSQAKRVAEKLGAQGFTHLGLPDNRLDGMDLLDLTKEIEEVIERVKPDTVYTQHGGDLNIDHQRIFRATLTATRPTGQGGVGSLYAYEVPSSTDWAFQRFAPCFEPNVFVDISDQLDAKIAAMESYLSEAREFPHPRSAQAVRATARRWGSQVGVEAAEAFQLIREIR